MGSKWERDKELYCISSIGAEGMCIQVLGSVMISPRHVSEIALWRLVNSLMMVSFGFMVAMLVAVLGVETVTFAGGTIALFLWLAWFFNFLKGL